MDDAELNRIRKLVTSEVTNTILVNNMNYMMSKIENLTFKPNAICFVMLNNVLFQHQFESIANWCYTNIAGEFEMIYGCYVIAFELESDAVLFRLTWS